MKEDGVLVMRFDGIIGSPAVSGIGIRRVPYSSGILVLYAFPYFDLYLLLVI